ncbi:MAG: hypothetical protein JKY95_08675 [Planctomycetaceae bacterium]|nr:hypothetical protein [Planctomycetaceae bacterium]
MAQPILAGLRSNQKQHPQLSTNNQSGISIVGCGACTHLRVPIDSLKPKRWVNLSVVNSVSVDNQLPTEPPSLHTQKQNADRADCGYGSGISVSGKLFFLCALRDLCGSLSSCLRGLVVQELIATEFLGLIRYPVDYKTKGKNPL